MESLLTFIILSPESNPANFEGPPLITSVTINVSLKIINRIPMPPKCP